MQPHVLAEAQPRLGTWTLLIASASPRRHKRTLPWTPKVPRTPVPRHRLHAGRLSRQAAYPGDGALQGLEGHRHRGARHNYPGNTDNHPRLSRPSQTPGTFFRNKSHSIRDGCYRQCAEMSSAVCPLRAVSG